MNSGCTIGPEFRVSKVAGPGFISALNSTRALAPFRRRVTHYVHIIDQRSGLCWTFPTPSALRPYGPTGMGRSEKHMDQIILIRLSAILYKSWNPREKVSNIIFKNILRYLKYITLVYTYHIYIYTGWLRKKKLKSLSYLDHVFLKTVTQSSSKPASCSIAFTRRMEEGSWLVTIWGMGKKWIGLPLVTRSLSHGKSMFVPWGTMEHLDNNKLQLLLHDLPPCGGSQHQLGGDHPIIPSLVEMWDPCGVVPQRGDNRVITHNHGITMA